MSTVSTILTGGLSLISLLYPPAAPIIGMIEMAAPYIEIAIPLIQAGITEGPGALKAAEDASPQLAAAIKGIAAHFTSLGVSLGSTDSSHAENIARVLFGFTRMTPEEEMKWMNDMTPGNDPSQENSKFTIG